jgi:two-component system response regulator NreC
MDPVKLLIADDHQIIIDGLKSLLRDVPFLKVVGEATNGRQALDYLKLIQVDLILMDIDMPVLNGIEATRLLKDQYPGVRVIILSMHNESGLIKTLLKSGADGYVLKNADREELIEAIKMVASGKSYFSADVTRSLAGEDESGPSAFQKDQRIAELTVREIEILKLVAEGYSNKEIGEKLFISHRTVDTHRTNLMKKLDVNNVAGIIRFAIRSGFIS